MSKKNVRITINGNPVKGAIEGAKQSAIKAAIQVANFAKELAPKKTSRLTNSIMWKTADKSGLFRPEDGSAPLETTPKGDDAIVGTNVQYGTYQEFGTKNMMARPFLRPAAKSIDGATLDQAMKEANRLAMKSAVEKGIKRTI